LEIETMNKFDALKMFQGWPSEWQRLCAECYIETGEDRPTQVWTTADKVQAAGGLVQRSVALPMPGDPWPFDQPKAAAKVAAKPKRKHHSKQAWSAAESEYLLKLASEDHPMWLVVDCFLEKYPGRSSDAIRRRTWGIRSGKPESEVKY
jgi:hypothetical protein